MSMPFSSANFFAKGEAFTRPLEDGFGEVALGAGVAAGAGLETGADAAALGVSA